MRGAGKSFLCHVASLLATGRRMDLTTQAADEAEEGKLITAVCRAGDVQAHRQHHAALWVGQVRCSADHDNVGGPTPRSVAASEPGASLHLVSALATTQFNARADTARRTLHIRLALARAEPEKRTGQNCPTWPAKSCGTAGDMSPTA